MKDLDGRQQLGNSLTKIKYYWVTAEPLKDLHATKKKLFIRTYEWFHNNFKTFPNAIN